MKKMFFIAFVFFGLQATQAQIQFGVKGGVNYNSESIKDVSQDFLVAPKVKLATMLVFGYREISLF